MAADEKWYFTKEQLANTPSKKCGFDADKELSSRQQAANFIQDMGQRLQVTQLCINTAIVYMHRFYMFHSFTRFHRNAMAAAALFLAAKVEEQPRKLEHVIKVAQICLHREQPPLDIKSELYMEQAQELVMNENILLQTLGFDVAIDHPHTHVVRCCTLVRASKDLAQTSYFMASNSLHLTTMCLQYKPTVVACFCIHLACKWSNWEIPQSNEGKPWFWYVDKTVTQELLEQLTEEFLAIFEKCPSRLKKKIMSLSSNQHSNLLTALNTDNQEKKRNGEGGNAAHQAGGMQHSNSAGPASSNNNVAKDELNRKIEYSQRHHPDYKKPHISSSHHSRIENVQNIPVKSSCMFGPPTRTQPPLPLTTNITSSTTTITSTSNNTSSSSSSNTSTSSLSGQRLPNSHKPIPPDQRPRRPEGHHSQPYKKEFSQHFFPQQPPTVEVPKPAVVPTVKVERSIFSPEVPSTPEPKPEPITRLKEETVEEPPPVIIPPVIKEEKIEVKPVIVEVKQPEPPPQQLVDEQHKEVKKKKKKHKEHKEHKEKHKEKHKHKKEKHKEPGPIVITIPKDKLNLPKEQPLKIKIPKDKIAPLPTSPVKLKIPKDKIKESRKRERSESPGSSSSSKRPNGAVQVTNIELKDTGLAKSTVVGPQTPPDIFEGNPNPENVLDSNAHHSPSSIPIYSSQHSTRPSQPLIPTNPSTRFHYNNTYNSSPSKFRGNSIPRHYSRSSYGRGRGRMRFPRANYYQAQFHPPAQPLYQPLPMAHFQYYIPIPTFPPPPPLPDEPPPELPPPPPPE